MMKIYRPNVVVAMVSGLILSGINYLIWLDAGIIKELIQRDDEAKYGTVRH